MEPLKQILSNFGGWPVVVGDAWDGTNFVWYEMIYQFRRSGYSIDYFVDFSVTTDLKNSTWRVIDVSLFSLPLSLSISFLFIIEICIFDGKQLDQATLGMPGREYLIKGLEDKDVKAYLEYQIGLATLLGADKELARKEQTEAVEFEIKLATVYSQRALLD